MFIGNWPAYTSAYTSAQEGLTSAARRGGQSSGEALGERETHSRLRREPAGSLGRATAPPWASVSLICTKTDVLLSRATAALRRARWAFCHGPWALHEPLLPPPMLSGDRQDEPGFTPGATLRQRQTEVKDKGPPPWGRTPRSGPHTIAQGSGRMEPAGQSTR